MIRRPGENWVGAVVRNYVFKDVKLKAMALVLAVMLWFSMTYLGESQMAFSVPIAFENLSKTEVSGMPTAGMCLSHSTDQFLSSRP